MSVEELALLEGYNEWVARRKIDLSDMTPAKFLEERVRADAAERVVRALDYISNNLSNDADVANIEAILNGSV